ncbi:MAG: hypothetical protein R3256_01950 [Thalassovita sp.]|nr:hypothetical protein [Thalassovita sp.]
MTRRNWHILREDGALILARRLPARFDLSVEAAFPRAGRLRLARQIRQDIWRALQDVRGFAPVVRVEAAGEGLRVRAGGQVDGVFPRQQATETLSALLSDPAHRARWVAYAGGARHV